MLPSHGRAFTGSVANPIIDARLENQYSLNVLAKRLGLSRQYLSRAEQGTYKSINPKLISWVAERKSISRSEVMRRYHAFQIATRKATREERPEVNRFREADYPNLKAWQAFAAWRADHWSSVISFCNSVCVHPETVRYYEEGIRYKMPEPLREALVQMDWIG